MNVYDRFEDVEADAVLLVERATTGPTVEISIATYSGRTGIVLSLQDARRMGEALIELAKANGA